MIWHITNLLLNKNIISDVGLKPSQSLAVPGREHDRFHPAPSGAMVTPDRLLKERQPASRPVQLTCGCKPVYRGGNETTAEAISRCASIVLSTPSALFLISPALQSIACKTNSTAKPSGARRSTSSTDSGDNHGVPSSADWRRPADQLRAGDVTSSSSFRFRHRH